MSSRKIIKRNGFRKICKATANKGDPLSFLIFVVWSMCVAVIAWHQKNSISAERGDPEMAITSVAAACQGQIRKYSGSDFKLPPIIVALHNSCYYSVLFRSIFRHSTQETLNRWQRQAVEYRHSSRHKNRTIPLREHKKHISWKWHRAVREARLFIFLLPWAMTQGYLHRSLAPPQNGNVSTKSLCTIPRKRKQKRVNENWTFDLNKSIQTSFGALKPQSPISAFSQDRKGIIVVKKLPIFYGY